MTEVPFTRAQRPLEKASIRAGVTSRWSEVNFLASREHMCCSCRTTINRCHSPCHIAPSLGIAATIYDSVTTCTLRWQVVHTKQQEKRLGLGTPQLH